MKITDSFIKSLIEEVLEETQKINEQYAAGSRCPENSALTIPAGYDGDRGKKYCQSMTPKKLSQPVSQQDPPPKKRKPRRRHKKGDLVPKGTLKGKAGVTPVVQTGDMNKLKSLLRQAWKELKVAGDQFMASPKGLGKSHRPGKAWETLSYNHKARRKVRDLTAQVKELKSQQKFDKGLEAEKTRPVSAPAKAKFKARTPEERRAGLKPKGVKRTQPKKRTRWERFKQMTGTGGLDEANNKLRITKETLQQIIEEEIQNVLSEQVTGPLNVPGLSGATFGPGAHSARGVVNPNLPALVQQTAVRSAGEVARVRPGVYRGGAQAAERIGRAAPQLVNLAKNPTSAAARTAAQTAVRGLSNTAANVGLRAVAMNPMASPAIGAAGGALGNAAGAALGLETAAGGAAAMGTAATAATLGGIAAGLGVLGYQIYSGVQGRPGLDPFGIADESAEEDIQAGLDMAAKAGLPGGTVMSPAKARALHNQRVAASRPQTPSPAPGPAPPGRPRVVFTPEQERMRKHINQLHRDGEIDRETKIAARRALYRGVEAAQEVLDQATLPTGEEIEAESRIMAQDEARANPTRNLADAGALPEAWEPHYDQRWQEINAAFARDFAKRGQEDVWARIANNEIAKRINADVAAGHLTDTGWAPGAKTNTYGAGGILQKKALKKTPGERGAEMLGFTEE